MTDLPPQVRVQLNEATAAQQRGQLARAEQLYRHLVRQYPSHAELHLRLTSLLMRQGKSADGANAARRLLRQFPGHLHGLYYLGAALAMQRQWKEAEAAYRQLVLRQPGHAMAHNDLGNVLSETDRLADAAESYRRALAVDPGFHQAALNLAATLLKRNEPGQAVVILQGIIKARPDLARAHTLLGTAFSGTGAFDDAQGCYHRALALDPGQADAHIGLGSIFLRSGRNEDALAAFRHASRISPGSVACNNEANAFKALGLLEDAETLYRKALALEPNFAQAAHNLGMVLCERGRVAEGFEAFMRAANRGPAFLGRFPHHKQAHDAEQQVWLRNEGLPERGQGAAPRLAAAINPALDELHMADRWQRASPQVIVVDDLLTPQALQSLQRFCLQSTMWDAAHEEGYLGAMPEHGFAPPLLAQIAEELPRRLSGIFGDHPLLHHWAFKYDSALQGIKVHADFAAVNVNFWITPDSANLDPESGGLVVWDVGAPLDWSFERYNCSDVEIRNLLQREGARATRIPYRANRAVIFDSDLFHETDVIRFRPGYENRRINVTLLYGRRNDAPSHPSQERTFHVN
jgi:tetratricopeptide (TPR) repeat protein